MAVIDLNTLLESLGLTEYESKTLATLFKLSEAEAPEVSRLAQVPKTRVYDVLDKLVKKNLIIEIRGRPKKYRVIDSRKTLEQLVEKRKAEVTELEKMAQAIKEQVVRGAKARESYGETVMKVKDRQDFEKILSQEIEGAENSIIGFSELTEKDHTLRESLEKAKEKNIEIQLLNSFSLEALKKRLKGIDVRQHEHGLNAFIIDNKKVVLAISDFKKEKQGYHFTIWHESKPMAALLNHYFEKCWKEGKA